MRVKKKFSFVTLLSHSADEPTSVSPLHMVKVCVGVGLPTLGPLRPTFQLVLLFAFLQQFWCQWHTTASIACMSFSFCICKPRQYSAFTIETEKVNCFCRSSGVGNCIGARVLPVELFIVPSCLSN